MSLARFTPAWDTGTARFVPAWQGNGASLTVDVDIDAGNIDASTVVITNATGEEPTVQVSPRLAGGDWRHFLFRVGASDGKRPIFRVNEANINGINMASAWRPMWTTDFETWHQFPSFTRDGTYLVFQGNVAFSDATVYVASHPTFRVTDSTAFANSLLAEPFVSPTSSADANGVYYTTVAETDENGRSIGQHDMYALKMDWGGPTADAGRKRVGVILCGIHAGEVVDGEMLKGYLDWIMNDPGQEAQAFRANWVLYLYFNITPNGRFGGHNRTNFRNSQDPNRNWDTAPLLEQQETQAAITADLGLPAGDLDAFFSFHGWRTDKEFLYYYPHNLDPTVESAWETALKSFEDTTGNFDKVQFNSSSYGEITWGVDQGATLAIAHEANQRGPSDQARYRQIGSYHARAVQILDADGVFVDVPASAQYPQMMMAAF